MSSLFSFFKAAAPKEDLEAVLMELDEKIRRCQVTLAEIVVKKNSYANNVLQYLGLVFSSYLAIYFLILRRPLYDSWGTSFIKFLPMVVFPFLIYYLRQLSNGYYDKQLNTGRKNLVVLQEKKKVKIEEIKMSANYNTTKNILERYGDPRKPISRSTSNVPMPLARQRTVGVPPTAQAIRRVQSNAVQGAPMQPFMSAAVNPKSQPLKPSTSSRWLDRLVEAIVGEEDSKSSKPQQPRTGGPGVSQQFALVCGHCFSHNGLVSNVEYDAMSYSCPKCGKFNPSRRSLRRQNSAANGRGMPGIQGMSRSMTSAVPRKTIDSLDPRGSFRVNALDLTTRAVRDSEEDASDDSGFMDQRRRRRKGYGAESDLDSVMEDE